MFSSRRKNEPPMEPIDCDNDEEMPYVSSDASNFDSFPREFGKYILFIILSILRIKSYCRLNKYYS